MSHTNSKSSDVTCNFTASDSGPTEGESVCASLTRAGHTDRDLCQAAVAPSVSPFSALSTGTLFRMCAGLWVLRKVDALTAVRVGSQHLDLAREFIGDERCIILQESQCNI